MTTIGVLDRVRAWLGRYVKVGDERDLDLVALWIAHTHLIGRVKTSPRLIITSPFPGAGKTTLLEHIEALSPRVTFASNALTAAVTSSLAREGRTILVDEADKHIGSGNESQRVLLGIVNAGYKHSGTYVVNVPDESELTGWRAAEVPVFGALAMAGISPDLPPDTRSRSLTVFLLPDVDDSVEETDWELIEDEAAELEEALATWASSAELMPGESLPEGVTARLREVWRPLKRVAVAAGGDWPTRADNLAKRHRDHIEHAGQEALLAERPHVVLARDLFGLWPEPAEYVATRELLSLLHTGSPEYWGTTQPAGRKALTEQRMGRMLSTNYGITSSRQEATGPRGYWRSQLVPIWQAIGLTGDGWTRLEPVS